jgi:transposase
VIDPRKTRLRAGVAAKTDNLDARRLADALRRDSVVPVYYPPPAIRELRELCRHRGSLVRLRVTLKQRRHALLLRQG